MDERDRRRYNDNERDYYTNNDRVDRDPRRGDPRDYRSSGRGYSADDRRPPYDRDGSVSYLDRGGSCISSALSRGS